MGGVRHDKFIAGQLAVLARQPSRQPDQRVKPVDRLRNNKQPLEEEIAAFEMPEFVQNHEPQFLVGKLVGESQRKKQARPPNTKQCRTGESVHFQNWDGIQPHGSRAVGNGLFRPFSRPSAAARELTPERKARPKIGQKHSRHAGRPDDRQRFFIQ